MPTMSFQNIRYGPNPFYRDQGAQMYYFFDVSFSDTPPADFTYTILMKDAAGTTVRTVTDTVPTDGQALVHVERWITATTDLGAPLPFGNYKNNFNLEVGSSLGLSLLSEDYPPVSTDFCSGRPVLPPPCADCDPCSVR